ncbi:hypothetical protein Acsp06_64110 [Actinomycetospora sp. NBRC 106375]|uniref:histidine phosphatase family protein n=1 Tax=Actinomycetospora sp. NBRC 106375 TaxID=3032207 RepID=UPI0024A3477F|nr:histidine phosphatase family protein [Actinomycetospora sp. NBRC 106375]GLZ50226.1 hypothetical protein Acsp06_64110 [Actinomycetospora sp. NBRC 106375]
MTARCVGEAWGSRGLRVHLVRHGESTWNAGGLVQGRTAHVPLSRRGLAQALELARTFARLPIRAVWTSDQLRCLQTAELIAARHHLPTRCSGLLREQRHGVWEGTPVLEHPELVTVADPDWAPEGGETARAVHGRAVAFVEELRRAAVTWPDDPPEVVVVSHGETIRALWAAALGHGAERMPPIVPGNAAPCSVLLAAGDGASSATAGSRPAPLATDAAR